MTDLIQIFFARAKFIVHRKAPLRKFVTGIYLIHVVVAQSNL